MKKIILLTVGIACSMPSFSQNLILQCDLINSPSYQLDNFYSKENLQKNPNILQDILIGVYPGLYHAYSTLPDNWIIDIKEKTISSPDGDKDSEFEIINISTSQIVGEKTDAYHQRKLSINRITGKLSYRVYVPDFELRRWSSEHGALPTAQCRFAWNLTFRTCA